jgi:hypothetical protein
MFRPELILPVIIHLFTATGLHAENNKSNNSSVGQATRAVEHRLPAGPPHITIPNYKVPSRPTDKEKLEPRATP